MYLSYCPCSTQPEVLFLNYFEEILDQHEGVSDCSGAPDYTKTIRISEENTQLTRLETPTLSGWPSIPDYEWAGSAPLEESINGGSLNAAGSATFRVALIGADYYFMAFSVALALPALEGEHEVVRIPCTAGDPPFENVYSKNIWYLLIYV